MKAHIKTANGRLTLEIEANTQKELFEGIADFQEVFEADVTCGCCNSTQLLFQARQPKDYKFYEMRCVACGAELHFGQSTDGKTLFPQRKAENGVMLPNRGWRKFQPRDAAQQP